MNLDSFLREYLPSIKDLFTIGFTGVATVLGILTYRRAKATILQPVRTEVVRKQSNILSELLALISGEEITAFDYMQIIFVNVYSVLLDYGFVFSNQKNLQEYLNSKRCAAIPCDAELFLRNVSVCQPFDDKRSKEETEKEAADLQRKRYEEAKKGGVIVIDKVEITKDHVEFVKKLSDFAANPFMPASIQESLKDLLHTVDVNLTVHLKEVLEDFTKEFFRRDSSENKTDFSVDGVHNEFNHKRFHHREQFDRIKEDIRNHLRIDEKW